MATTYVFTEVPVGENLNLYVDGNSKITVGNGSYDEPSPNALSIPHISTCPGATAQCMISCYVFGLQKNAPDVYAKYCHNERVIHRFLSNSTDQSLAAWMFSRWIIAKCPDGFRWHVSGDVMSEAYARWIVSVARNSSNVRHWIYTRTLSVVELLCEAPNMAVNISADAGNYKQAREIAKLTGARICYLTSDGTVPNDMEKGDVIFPDYSLRGRELAKPSSHPWWQNLSPEHKRMVCLADFAGQSERHRCGPCNKCLEPMTPKIPENGVLTVPSPVLI